MDLRWLKFFSRAAPRRGFFQHFIRDNIVCLPECRRRVSATCQLITGDTCFGSRQTSYCHTWMPIIVNSAKRRRAVVAGPRGYITAAASRHAEDGFLFCERRGEAAPRCHGNLNISDCILQTARSRVLLF